MTKGSVLPAPPMTPGFWSCTERLSRAAGSPLRSLWAGFGVADRAWASLLAHPSLPPRAAERPQQPRDRGKQWQVFGQVSQRSLFNEQSRALISPCAAPAPCPTPRLSCRQGHRARGAAGMSLAGAHGFFSFPALLGKGNPELTGGRLRAADGNSQLRAFESGGSFGVWIRLLIYTVV